MIEKTDAKLVNPKDLELLEKINPLDFRMPADFERQGATWLVWPHDYTWKGEGYTSYQLKLERQWIKMADILTRYGNKANIIVQDGRIRDHADHMLTYYGVDMKKVEYFEISSDDIWICDPSPAFSVNAKGEMIGINWTFNGWGGRYPSENDNKIAPLMCEKLGIPYFSPPLCLESGHELNGKGTFIATRTSIINPNRNPHLNQQEVEKILKTYIGVKHFIWLSGMSGDDPELGPEDTDCHIDLETRFVNENTLLYRWPEDESGPWFERVTKVHMEELKNAVTESGKKIEIVKVPAPKNTYWTTENVGGGGGMQALGARKECMGSYLDWHVANGVVMVPVYGDVNDERALKIIQEHFPGRDVIGMDIREIWENGGGNHCVTKAQPQGIPCRLK